MKKIIFILIFCCSQMALFAQSGNQNNGQTTDNDGLIGPYFFNNPIILTSCSAKGDTDPNGTVTRVSYIHQYFNVLSVNQNGDVIIEIEDYGDTNDIRITEYTYHETNTKRYNALETNNKSLAEYGDNQFYFKITQSQLKNSATKNSRIGGSLAFGVLNYPFKYRGQPQHQNFSGSFNLGAAIGLTFRHKSYAKFSYSLVSGYSISNITLDSASVTRNATTLQSNNNFTALSISLGGMVTYQNKIQAGLFLGTDVLNKLTDQTYDWIYQGRPWFSIGFGYSIFSNGEEKTDNNAKN